MEEPTWVSHGINPHKPSAARVYDVHLGGSHNFAIDREVARQMTELLPDMSMILRANRSFLRRAVRYLVDVGITQFLDLGSGIPTVGNVHEIAQHANPGCKVVYVDIDPIAVAHSRAILGGNNQTTVVLADLRQPDGVLGAPELQQLLDFSQPIAVLMVAVLHFVPDTDDPSGIVARYLDPIVPGSYLVISHASQDGVPADQAAKTTEMYSRAVTEFALRTRDQVAKLFTGLELVEPGVVFLPEWHPDSRADLGNDPKRISAYGGVARKL